MKKLVFAGLVISVLFFTSCSGVSQEQYNSISNNLTAAEAQIQSLHNDKTAAQALIDSLQNDKTAAQAQVQSLQSDKQNLTDKAAEALLYTEFIDLVYYPAWIQAGITPRYTFVTETDWYVALKNKADSIGDAKLTNLIQQIEAGGSSANTATYEMFDYCTEKVEELLK